MHPPFCLRIVCMDIQQWENETVHGWREKQIQMCFKYMHFVVKFMVLVWAKVWIILIHLFLDDLGHLRKKKTIIGSFGFYTCCQHARIVFQYSEPCIKMNFDTKKWCPKLGKSLVSNPNTVYCKIMIVFHLRWTTHFNITPLITSGLYTSNKTKYACIVYSDQSFINSYWICHP